MKTRNKAMIEAFYIVLLASVFGSTMALGIFVAPVIFKASMFMDSLVMDRFESGLIMSEIFRRYAYLLGFSMIVVAVYEIYSISKGERGTALISSVTAVLITGFLFALYYTPAILGFQALGVEATVSQEFETIHKQAESAFKVLFFALGILIFLRVLRLQKLY